MASRTERWADVGRAMNAASGIKRELVRTLQTTDRKEAIQRRDAALKAMRDEVDAALRRAKRRPLTDWTADWEARAIERREQLRLGAREVLFEEEHLDPATGYTIASPVTG